MATSPYRVRRSTRERIVRLARHPIATIREAKKNRQDRDWHIYYAAAKLTDQTEPNAREFAHQISGKAMMPSPIRGKVKSFHKPLANKIRQRQNVKEEILRLVNQVNELSRKMRTPHLSTRKRDAIARRQEKLENRVYFLQEVRLPRITQELKNTLEKMTKYS